MHRTSAALVVAFVVALPQWTMAQPARDSSEIKAVLAAVHAYRNALRDGDSATALALLSQDAIILESGDVETREDYRAHHLPADIEFAKSVPGQRGKETVTIRGDVAWVSSTSISEGTFRGRAVNSSGAELMVLSREGSAWKIRAIHWSSRARRSAGAG